MSSYPTLPESILIRWQDEAQALKRAGIYRGLAQTHAGQRVLEIGCGVGISTSALRKTGAQVLVLESVRALVETQHAQGVEVMHADLLQGVTAAQLATLIAWQPQTMVVWFIGHDEAYINSQYPDLAPMAANRKFRLAVQQKAAELAQQITSLQLIHTADRSAIPWQAKQHGRLVALDMMNKEVYQDFDFKVVIDDIGFEKIPYSPSSKAGASIATVPVVLSTYAKRCPATSPTTA